MPDKPFYNHPPGADYHIPRKRDPGNVHNTLPTPLAAASSHPQLHVRTYPREFDAVLQGEIRHENGWDQIIDSQREQQSGKFQFLCSVITQFNSTSDAAAVGPCIFLHANA